VKIREFKLEMDGVIDPMHRDLVGEVADAWFRDNAAELNNEQMRVKRVEVEAETGKVLVTVEVLAGLTLEGM
jgi:hypothetical protein